MFQRYAIYYTASGSFATHGAAWLGWDVAQGNPVAHPDLEGVDLASLTETPRKYGFHGTLKPPFHLAHGTTAQDLQTALRALSTSLTPVTLPGLEAAALGRFLALVPTETRDALNTLAAEVVRGLDMFRAPASPDEIAKRRKARLSPAQEQNLMDWGYPHVMDQFRFHMTLSNRLPRAEVAKVKQAAQTYFAPILPRPFTLDALSLVGQRSDGKFALIDRCPLS